LRISVHITDVLHILNLFMKWNTVLLLGFIDVENNHKKQDKKGAQFMESNKCHVHCQEKATLFQ
jgi:hypothetical protein